MAKKAKGIWGHAKVIKRRMPHALAALSGDNEADKPVIKALARIQDVLDLLAKRQPLDKAQQQTALIHLLDTLWRLSTRLQNWPRHQNINRERASFHAANARQEIDDIRLCLRAMPGRWAELTIEIQTELNALGSVNFPPVSYDDSEDTFAAEVVESFNRAVAMTGDRIARLQFKLDAYIEWRFAGGNPDRELFISKLRPPARREAATHSVLVLEESQARHKQQEMVQVLKERFGDAAGAVRDALSDLKNANFLTNKEDDFGKGYGLPEWDDELSG